MTRLKLLRICKRHIIFVCTLIDNKVCILYFFLLKTPTIVLGMIKKDLSPLFLGRGSSTFRTLFVFIGDTLKLTFHLPDFST